MTPEPNLPESAPPGLALDLHHVAKTYRGRVQALRGVDMKVARGEIFGLLGPNGAGKSTLVKILMTVIRPSRCEGTLLGERVGSKAALRRIGYLPEHHKFPGYLRGDQVLDFYGALAGVERRERRRRRGELLTLVGMSAWARKKVGGYSKGMRQRLGIAQALMSDPELVVLDEPTDGVDPVGRRDIRNMLSELKREGRTVFLNSHLLSELEMVCDRVAIMVQGLVTRQGTIDGLTDDKRYYEIALGGSEDAAPTLREALAGEVGPGATPDGIGASGTLASGEWFEIEGDVLRVGTAEPERIRPVLARVLERGGVVRSVRPRRPSLEDLFMEAVTDPETGQTLEPGAADRKGRRR